MHCNTMVRGAPKQIFGKSWAFGPRRGGRTQSQLLQITVFMAYLTLFLPKIFDKFTEKIPTFGEGGQAGWAKFPTFTDNLFWGLPLVFS